MIFRRRAKKTNPTIFYTLDRNDNPDIKSILIISPNNGSPELGLIMPDSASKHYQITNYQFLEREVNPKYDKLRRVVEKLTGLESKAA